MAMTATLTEAPPVPVVGAIVPDPRRGGSVRVMVQGRPLLTIPREVAERERLDAGSELGEALFARLCRAADEEAAFRTSLRFLERRPFAARDLTRRLVLKGHPPQAAEAARPGRRGWACSTMPDSPFTTCRPGLRGGAGHSVSVEISRHSGSSESWSTGPSPRRSARTAPMVPRPMPWRADDCHSSAACPGRSSGGVCSLSWRAADLRGTRLPGWSESCWGSSG